MALRTSRYALIDWIYRRPIWLILAAVVGFYLALGLAFGLVYLGLQEGLGITVVVGPASGAGPGWADYLYFSFMTQTTVGFGDFLAAGPGKVLASLQAVAGLFLVSLVIPLVIVKIWSPKDAVVFARQAECVLEDDQRFAHLGFRCLNTHKLPLNDVRVMGFFIRRSPRSEVYGLLNEQIPVSPDLLPDMGRAVWFFHSSHDHETALKLYNLINASAEYSFKVLVLGTYGRSNYSIVHEYRGADFVSGRYAPVAEEPDGSRAFADDFDRVLPAGSGGASALFPDKCQERGGRAGQGQG